ncbi:Atg6/Beclin [Phytophthora cactorum]|nr:Atg6/Beclin [Phytophthora cactorum]
MDRSTTYCYYISEKYSQEQPVEDDVLVHDQGSSCPITIRVDIADELEKNALIPLRYTATLDTSSADANFEFPDPIVRVPVPDYLLGHTNTSTESSSSTNETTYDVAVANVVMCDWRSCDLFSTASESSTYYSSSNNPNDFTDNVAVFGSEELVIPKDGNSITTDGTTTYCWTSKDVSVFDPSVSGDLTIRTGEYCPGTMSMSLSSTEVNVGDTIDIAWMLDMSDSSTDDSMLIAEVSSTDAIKNPRTDIYSVVPVSVFSGCQRNLAGANCSTYTGDDSSTFAIAEFDDMNLTSDAVSYSTSYTFENSGQYTMFGRVAMVTVDGERIDMAIYSSVTVSVDGGSGGSNLFLYVGIGIGAAILLAGMLFCYMKKRHNNVSTKDIPFRQPVSGLERASDYTMASSNFLSHKTPAQLQGLDMSGDYSANNAAPSYLAVNAADSGVFDKTIRAEPGQMAESVESSESFSLNPYDRASFAGLSDDVASSRPSDISKFSFQSGYDDESEWDYDTRQLRGVDRGSDFSDFSSDPGTSLPASGTYEMGRATNMPILEEDYLDEPHDFNKDHQPNQSSSTIDPRKYVAAAKAANERHDSTGDGRVWSLWEDLYASARYNLSLQQQHQQEQRRQQAQRRKKLQQRQRRQHQRMKDSFTAAGRYFEAHVGHASHEEENPEMEDSMVAVPTYADLSHHVQLLTTQQAHCTTVHSEDIEQIDDKIRFYENELIALEESLKLMDSEREVIAQQQEAMNEEEKALINEEAGLWDQFNGLQLQESVFQEIRDAGTAQIDAMERKVASAKHLNILTDMFVIGYDGAFGTINQFRMGQSASFALEWNEINAAFGECALLLQTLANMVGLEFSEYVKRLRSVR